MHDANSTFPTKTENGTNALGKKTNPKSARTVVGQVSSQVCLPLYIVEITYGIVPLSIHGRVE